MFDNAPNGPITVLTEAESWKMLATTALGRLAVSVANRPEIFPVNFYVDHDSILIRTAQGTKLVSLTINENVAFEADGYSESDAWSVVARGTAVALESQEEIMGANSLPFKPWVPTLKYVFVRITPTEISGRHFQLGPEPDRY
jgi:uncharacterized protein